MAGQIKRRVIIRFTSAAASWLNLGEVWFGLLNRKTLQGASFPTKEALREGIKDFIRRMNGNPGRFV